MNAKDSTRTAVKHLKNAIAEQGQVHFVRIVRKHLSENPRIAETVPTLKAFLTKKASEWRIQKSQLGLESAFENEKKRMASFATDNLLRLTESIHSINSEIRSKNKINTALKVISRTAGLQWGTLLPPRNLKLQHHKLEQHFIVFRRVPLFIAEVSTEWWSIMLEQALRKSTSEQEKTVLRTLESLVSDFKKGYEQGMDIHTYLQQTFSLKNEVLTARDLTIPLDPFSFQMMERFFSSLLNPQKGE